VPVDTTTNKTMKEIWFPPGEWISWETGEHFIGPIERTITYGMSDIPVFASAGSIIPMKYSTIHGTVADPLVFTVFPGSSGTAEFYEDDGETLAYQTDSYWKMRINQITSGNTQIVAIYPQVEGKGYPTHLENRNYEIHLRGITATNIEITCNDTPIPPSPGHTAPGWWIVQENMVDIAVIALGSYKTNVILDTKITFS